MGHQVIRQPDGKLAVFSSGTGRWIRWDCEPEELVEWYAQRAAEDARRSARNTVDAVLAGTEIYDPRFVLTFEEANKESGESGGVVLPAGGGPSRWEKIAPALVSGDLLVPEMPRLKDKPEPPEFIMDKL